MHALPVILIFDVGKTNKKVLLFDKYYQVVYEESYQLETTHDDDNYPAENLEALTAWVQSCFQKILAKKEYDVRAVNFSAYGASFVYLNDAGKTFLPLYNYLKPYPQDLLDDFYNQYGGAPLLCLQTASPKLGNLNSGLQLYHLKFKKPDAFRTIRHALHLPQYLSWLLTNEPGADITSIGCHTHLWDFTKNNYHEWVSREGLLAKFPPIKGADHCKKITGQNIQLFCGTGLHDSSAALIPYLETFHEPFVLLSTGTWCITLNPFNDSPLTQYELEKDCLCYLTFKGNPVKASRFFGGFEHEEQIQRLASFYHVSPELFTNLRLDGVMAFQEQPVQKLAHDLHNIPKSSIPFNEIDLNQTDRPEKAYLDLMIDIAKKQVRSTGLVLQGSNETRIFVDGGFSKNNIYMGLLALAFPAMGVYAASMPQASALGAALAIHKHWNDHPLPENLIKLDRY